MTDVRISGYKAEAQTALSGDLDSLGDNSWSALSSEIDNSTFGYMFADLELYLASLVATGADAAVEVYLVPSIDGASYPDFDVSAGTDDRQENNQYFVGSFTLESSGGTFRGSLRGIELPPGKFKFGVRNRANVNFASTGNTLRWRPWQYASA